MMLFVYALLGLTGVRAAAIHVAQDAELNHRFLAREHQLPSLGLGQRQRLSHEYDFRLAQKTHRNNQGRFVHGEEPFIASVGSPPKLAFSGREDAKWSVEITEDVRAVFLSTLDGW